jgi:hypothetical protein
MLTNVALSVLFYVNVSFLALSFGRMSAGRCVPMIKFVIRPVVVKGMIVLGIIFADGADALVVVFVLDKGILCGRMTAGGDVPVSGFVSGPLGFIECVKAYFVSANVANALNVNVSRLAAVYVVIAGCGMPMR